MQRYSIFILILFIGSCLAIVDVNSCTTSHSFKSNFMNECYKDDTKYSVPTAIASQLTQWFLPTALLVYCVVVLLVTPGLSNQTDDDTTESAEAGARVNLFRLNTISLMFRIALGWSLSFWLKVVIQQDRPCACRVGDTSIYVPLTPGIDDKWGMPSAIALTSAIVGLHFIEKISVVGGLLFALLMAGSRIALGYNSLGQVLAGLGFGLLVHFYCTRTPSFMRIVDFFMNLIAAFVSFFVVRRNSPDADFTFTSGFFEATVWQIFAFCIVFIIFEWSFTRSVLKKNSHSVDVPDFLYYMPLNEMRGPRQTNFKKENALLGVYIAILFIFLAAIRVFTPYIDDFFKLGSKEN